MGNEILVTDGVATACLIGNGASIAYNQNLAVPLLTAELIKRFNIAGKLLPAFANAISAQDNSGFEQLLGSFSSASDALRLLPQFIEVLKPDNPPLGDSVEEAANLLRDVYRKGVGITLHLISDLASGCPSQHETTTALLCSKIWDLGPRKNLTVATLNYDGLLHSGFIDGGTDQSAERNARLADLADGREPNIHDVLPGVSLRAHPLRAVDDIPDDRMALLQLHGSLSWLRHVDKPEEVWRFTLQDLRNHKYWQRFADGGSQWEPVVVLTNQKSKVIGRWPFSLAYETFTQRLAQAERWLVAGYGFGDEPVNEAFRHAARQRKQKNKGLSIPRVLVIDRPENANAFRTDASKAVGVPVDNVTVCAEGLPDALNSAEWAAWAHWSA